MLNSGAKHIFPGDIFLGVGGGGGAQDPPVPFGTTMFMTEMMRMEQ